MVGGGGGVISVKRNVSERAYLNCTDNYDVKIKVKSVSDNQ